MIWHDRSCAASAESYSISAGSRLTSLFMIASILVAIWESVSFAAVSASFHALGGTAPTVGAGQDTKSAALAVSGDGNTIVGREGLRPVRWTGLTGPISLVTPTDGVVVGNALDVSYNGSVIVGAAVPEFDAFRWTAATGVIDLNETPGGGHLIEARGVSGNGRVVVGSRSSTTGREVYRWTAENGVEILGSLDDDHVFAIAEGASHDGSVIVGQSSTDLGIEPFRWTAGTGMVGLGTLPGGRFNSGAFGVSADGSVVVGFSYLTGADFHAFRWTEATGMVDLGDLSGGENGSLARGVSRDGNLIVGLASSSHGYEAFIWRSHGGMRSLQTVLTDDFGLNLDGWMLREAWGVSANGTVIVGTGVNPQGFVEGWRVTLPIPEPASILLLGVGSCALTVMRAPRSSVAGR